MGRISAYGRNFRMKRTFCMLAIGLMGAWAAAAQTSASGQAGASMQSQTSMQGTSAGAQASGNGSAAASAATSAADNTANIVSGTKIDASLATSLDAKRSKAGDEVEVRTEEDIKQGGKVVLKKGTRLVGHVTQAQARANGQAQSQLGIVFDRAVLKNGQEMPFSASIQALASAQSAAASSVAADDAMASERRDEPNAGNVAERWRPCRRCCLNCERFGWRSGGNGHEHGQFGSHECWRVAEYGCALLRRRGRAELER